jgi:hypothetical protein
MTVREYTYGNAIIAIYRPELSEKELKRREERLLIALEQYGKEVKENEKNGNTNKSRNFRSK